MRIDYHERRVHEFENSRLAHDKRVASVDRRDQAQRTDEGCGSVTNIETKDQSLQKIQFK